MALSCCDFGCIFWDGCCGVHRQKDWLDKRRAKILLYRKSCSCGYCKEIKKFGDEMHINSILILAGYGLYLFIIYKIARKIK